METFNNKDAQLYLDSERIRAARVARKTKTPITKCSHVDKPYYAKGLCQFCYHRKGRQKLAKKCVHSDCTSYAFGMCKRCYFKEYQKGKRNL